MDTRLISWARAVKARHRLSVPTLWLFTDAARAPDPLPAIARLPRHLCGVVFRHDGVPGRAALAQAVAKLCRARGLALSIAGDPRLAAALGAGQHCRGGTRPRLDFRPPHALLTASAHNPAQLQRARVTGAAVIFVSPVFATASHQGDRVLGATGFARLSRECPALALGGINAASARACPPRLCRGAGAIAALAPTPTAQPGSAQPGSALIPPRQPPNVTVTES